MKEGIRMAGRKPKPTVAKKLEGNPGKRKLNSKEPAPAKGMAAFVAGCQSYARWKGAYYFRWFNL